MAKKKTGNAGRTVIFRSSMTLPNGKVIYAKDYGKKAFAIPIGNGGKNGNSKGPKGKPNG